MNNTTKLTNTKSTQSTYFKIKDLAKSQATHAKKIKKLTVHYTNAYARAVSDIALYLPDACDGVDSSTNREKVRIIKYNFYKCIVTLLGFSQIPESYATAFYIANMEEINSLMVDELNQLLTENN